MEPIILPVAFQRHERQIPIGILKSVHCHGSSTKRRGRWVSLEALSVLIANAAAALTQSRAASAQPQLKAIF